jgi:hypothetical protein
MKNLKFVFIILAVILVLSGCANGKIIPDGKKNTIKEYAAVCLEYLPFDETMESATHIVDAVYSGEGDNGTYVFEVVDTLKGEVPEAGITVYDIDSSHVYSKGVCYLLFLIKTISVFHYEHPKYESIGSSLITENDADWKEKHETVEAAKDSFADSVKEYGSPFIVTDSLKEVLDFAPNIFVVTVESIYAKSPESPTTAYVCKVKECLKGKVEETLIINGAARIVITLFNGTVRLNHDYVVLLWCADQNSPIYGPAAPKLNVFDISHYDAIKARLS